MNGIALPSVQGNMTYCGCSKMTSVKLEIALIFRSAKKVMVVSQITKNTHTKSPTECSDVVVLEMFVHYTTGITRSQEKISSSRSARNGLDPLVPFGASAPSNFSQNYYACSICLAAWGFPCYFNLRGLTEWSAKGPLVLNTAGTFLCLSVFVWNAAVPR